MSTIRKQSIEYWNKRNPHVCFRTFLLCLYRISPAKVPSDIRKMLFSYFMHHIYTRFHKTKDPFRAQRLELLSPIVIKIPAGTLKCVHISAKMLGRENSHVKMAFLFEEDSVLMRKILQTENDVKSSLVSEKKLTSISWRPFIKGKTLFYAMNVEQGYRLSGVELEPYYTDLPEINLNKNWYATRKNKFSPFVIKINEKVNFNVDLHMKAVDKKYEGWSLNFSLDPVWERKIEDKSCVIFS